MLIEDVNNAHITENSSNSICPLKVILLKLKLTPK